MSEIKTIVIKGCSGYCCIDEAFEDKVTIAADSISYEYKPDVESKANLYRKWSYKTNSPIFKIKFSEIARMLPGILNSPIEAFCTDIGGIEFVITYADKTKLKKQYWLPGEHFANLFNLIKSIVPKCEYIPAVLLTDEDYGMENNDM